MRLTTSPRTVVRRPVTVVGRRGCPLHTTKWQRRGSGGANTSGSNSNFWGAPTGVAEASHSQASISSASSSLSQATARETRTAVNPRLLVVQVPGGLVYLVLVVHSHAGSVRVSGPPPTPSAGPTQRMTTLNWSEHLNVALSQFRTMVISLSLTASPRINHNLRY